MLYKRIILILFLLCVVGCGFRPIHAPNTSTSHSLWADFAAIDIYPIPERSGQILYNKLEKLFHPGGRARIVKYRLKINLVETAESLSVKKSAFATRANLKISATFSLEDIKSGRSIFNSRGNVISGFNIFSLEYASLAAEKDARQRAISELAAQIQTRVSAALLSKSRVSLGEDPESK